MHYTIEASQLRGTLKIPPSKSHTLRAILLASFASGQSVIRNYLASPDTDAMIKACTQLGATITKTDDHLIIAGTNGHFHVPEQVIDVGNSGQVLRFIAAMAALIPHYTVLTGDASIRHIRPMQPLLDALTQAGALAVSSKGDGHAPVIIKGPIQAARMVLDGQDSQPVSALLMMAAFLKGETSIEVRDPGEKSWVGLTLHWLQRIGVAYQNDAFTHYKISGPAHYAGFEYQVPGDWSSAAFPIAAALITNATLTLENLDREDPQGDKAILQTLSKMGAKFDFIPEHKQLKILPHEGLIGVSVDVNDMIDAVPILAIIACFAQSKTHIKGAAIARHKESDRLNTIAIEAKKMGAHMEVLSDGLMIYPSQLHGAAVESHHDHRIAMALAVAGLACGKTNVHDTDCVAKSYPEFAQALQTIGAKIKVSHGQ